MSSKTEQPSSAAAASQDASSTPNPSFIIPIIASLFSSSGQARDWLVILVIGSILEHTRRFFVSVWKNLVNQFWITVTLEEWDESYCKSHSLILKSLYELHTPSYRLDDAVAIEETRMDAGQGVVDQHPFVWGRGCRRIG